MVQITEDTEVELVAERLDEEELDALSFVLDVEVDSSSATEPRIRSCRLDVERLVRVMTVFDSASSFKYDWRRGQKEEREETRDHGVYVTDDNSNTEQ